MFMNKDRLQVLRLCGWGDMGKDRNVDSIVQHLMSQGQHTRAAAMALLALRLKQTVEVSY